ncbi:MAG: protein nirF [Rhodocyclaceae bacterium]|nr:protein nirF [Rhodocyclaceae bacterium]
MWNSLSVWIAALLLSACAQAPLRGSGDLGVVIERASGSVQVVDTTQRAVIGRITGLGDLSHASVVFSRDQRHAFVFGRDGSLSKVDLLTQSLVKRVQQAGNAIGGAVSQDGSLVVAQNYEPGGIKAFRSDTLEQVADVPASYGSEGKRSKVVGLADLSGNRFVYALFDAGEIRITDLSDPSQPKTQSWPAGKQPYDGLVTPDGRHFIAGLFGEDGLAVLDTWQPQQGVKKVLSGYGRGQAPLPVYKMPHLRGWAQAGGKLYLPAIGRHEVLVVDRYSWREVGRIAVKSQPVFVMARPDGREVWVNFAFPDNSHVQIIDTLTQQVTHTLRPGNTVLHMEFTPRGEQAWVSVRDDNRVLIYDTATHTVRSQLDANSPSGIFFSARAARTGF